MSEQNSIEIESDVPQEWTQDHMAAAYCAHHAEMEAQARETTQAIMEAAEIAPGQTVIDIGSGSGIPALAIADRVGPAGKVIATDPSPIFVAAAESIAKARGLTNLIAERASVMGLRHPAQSFDAATLHFSGMFFPDLNAGFSKVHDLLKPGARAGLVAWGNPAENAPFRIFWGIANTYLTPEPTVEPERRLFDFPNPMRFSEPGSITSVMNAAGFSDVREEARIAHFVWPGSPESLLSCWLELSRMQERLSANRFEEFKTELLRRYETFRTEAGIALPAGVVIASGAA